MIAPVTSPSIGSQQQLRLEDVHHRFGEREVLRGFTASVPLTGVTFIVGRSGAGKSVLCRLAVGLLRPTSGTVQLFEADVPAQTDAGLRGLRQRAPYLVQAPALLDWLSVRSNVALARRSATTHEVDAVLERVGVSRWAERIPTELGPGIQKRVAMARALLLQPECLLLDEPTTGLDPAASSRVMEVLRRLRDDGLGALVVSHDYRALAEVADRVLVVSEGKARYLGSAQDFLASTDADLVALRGSFDGQRASDG